MAKSKAQALVELASKKEKRIKTSLYLSEKLYAAFVKKCGTASKSRVLEELIREFVER